MGSRHRRHIRNIFAALFLLTAAAWLAPSFLSAERYRRRLQAGLEYALKRPVTFGAVSFRFLPRPGFTIENAVVREDPAFGLEPFARVDRIECDLQWRSFWQSRLDFARLRLERPSLNVVRNARGEWNVESLLRKSRLVTPADPGSGPGQPSGVLSIVADNARLDFKSGADKKPFAVTDLEARLNFDPARGLVRFRLAGTPIRTDRSLPGPGVVELTGEWAPGPGLDGPLNATLRTREALLYNWVPLLSGQNPEIYGVLDAEVRLTGSWRVVKVEGQFRINQLHRWELLPPSEPMPVIVRFRGEFDRRRARALVESLDASFSESHLHLSGAVERVPGSPELDLVLALERSRLEDWLALGRRFWGDPGAWDLSGRVDGLLTVQGEWDERRYGGFVTARDVQLKTPSGAFPISEVALRINDRGARMAPVRLALASRVELTAEGALYRPRARDRRRHQASLPRYELNLSAKSVPLHDVLRLGRALGVSVGQGLEAEGVGTASFRLSGSAWPPTRPALTGSLELRAARLLVPGLTEPLNLPRARVRVNGDRITADPVVAVLGTSVFTARLEHQGGRENPWQFEVRANSLSVEQGALWFDVLGHRPPLPVLERIPGLRSFSARRVAASRLFSALNVKGHFEAPTVTYRSLTLEDFQASVGIAGRIVRIDGASFGTGGGRGQGRVEVDLTDSPPRLTGGVTLAGGRLESVASHLPSLLRKVRGGVSGTAHFETRGLTRGEMRTNLKGAATVRLRRISLGDFDPLQAISRRLDWGMLLPAPGQVVIPLASADVEAQDGRLILKDCVLRVDGAELKLAGTYGSDATLEMDVRADFRQLTRPLQVQGGEQVSKDRVGRLRLAGPLDKLAAAPEVQLSSVSR